MSAPVSELLGTRRGVAPRGLRSYAGRVLGGDVLALACTALMIALLSPTPSPTGEIPGQPLAWSLAFTASVLAGAALRGDYRAPMRPDLLELLRQVLTTTAVGAIIVLTARVLLADDKYAAAQAVRHWLALLPLLAGARVVVLWRETRARRHGLRTLPTLIVGAGHIGQRVERRLRAELELGLNPVAFLDHVEGPKDGPRAPLPVYPPDGDLAQLVRELGIRHAIFAFPYGGDGVLPDIARRLWELDVSVGIVPRLFELGGERPLMAHLGGLPVASMSPAAFTTWRMSVKYALDAVCAAAALAVLSPVLIAAAIAVRTSLGSPILFRQRRMGNDHHGFEILKFRTLRGVPEGGPEADAAWAAAAVGRDPAPSGAGLEDRTTAVTRFLRRHSIDELPQLWNVLRGDMSLIGPRPERVDTAELFAEVIDGYRDRHRMRSGLTGWAQVSGLRGATSLTDRVEWDNHYIENWTPWLDFKILLLTVPQLLRHPDP
ncbi:MAG: exopolysaccharide biosynthesis polyprenyl glycosylphosphotransferase [Thermoleophilia bacterium]